MVTQVFFSAFRGFPPTFEAFLTRTRSRSRDASSIQHLVNNNSTDIFQPMRVLDETLKRIRVYHTPDTS